MPQLDYQRAIADVYADLQPLETPRLRLERFDLAMVPDAFAYTSDPEVVALDPTALSKTEADAEAFVSHFVTLHGYGLVSPWAVRHKDDDRHIGICGFVNWGPVSDRAELGFLFARPYWRQGLASEALAHVIDFGFDVMKLNRIEGKTRSDNLPARRVLERLGFSHEALLRQNMFWKGSYHDLAMYSMLRADRPPAPESGLR